MKKTKNFNFKQFKIEGGFCGMPISTDGVLLGAWANIEQVSTLLDIGTGTGLLSLMCAQRNQQLKIDAIDVNAHAVDAAQENFAHSPWGHRLSLISGNVLSYNFIHRYDAIICNPPYFNNGEQAHDNNRATARHTEHLSHPALLERCWALLTEVGTASFILPKVEGDQFINLAQQTGWQLQRLCQVRPIESKPISRLLIQLGKKKQKIENKDLIIHSQSGYSHDFIALTKAFYLKM